MTAWPRVATILVLAIFLFGFVEGTTHWSYRTIVGSNGFAGNVLAPSATANDWGGPTGLVFAENLVLLLLAVGIGSLSANLGVTLVSGYVLGDLLRGPAATEPGWGLNDPVNAWLYTHVPLLASYLLFFLLVALPIMMAMELARSSHTRVRQSKTLSIGLAAVLQSVLIYCWGCMAPMVFRTVMLWRGGDPRIQVPFYSEVVATWLVPTAFVAVVVRAGLVRTSGEKDHPFERIRAGRVAMPRLPYWLRAVIAAGIVTLLLTGFLHTPGGYEAGPFESFLETEFVFLGLVVALLVSTYLLPRVKRWQSWTAQVNQYPGVLRLAAATVVTYVVCLVLVIIPGLQSGKGGEFGPEVAAILIGLAITVALLPTGWSGLQQPTRALPRIRLRMPSRATRLALIGFIVLIATRKAFGDCYDYFCCMLGLPTVAAAAAAGTIPSLGGLAGGLGTASDPCQKERDAVARDQDSIAGLQAEIDALQSQLAGLQDQVSHEIVDLQNQGLLAQAESAMNPALSGLIATITAQLQSLGSPAALLAPGTSPVAFFSNPSLSGVDAMGAEASGGLALSQMPTGQPPMAYPSPATTQFLQGVMQLQAQLPMANSLLNSIQNLQDRLADAQANLKNNERGLAECEASHSGHRKS